MVFFLEESDGGVGCGRGGGAWDMLNQDAIRTRPGTETEQQWALCYVPFYAPPKAYTDMVFLSYFYISSITMIIVRVWRSTATGGQ